MQKDDLEPKSVAWLELITKSNEANPEEPAKLWNEVQLAIERSETRREIGHHEQLPRIVLDHLKRSYGYQILSGDIQEIDLKHADISGCDFTGANFLLPVYANEATFEDTKFDRAIFSKGAYFLKATATKNVSFRSVTFRNKASFLGIRCDNGMDFAGSVFKGPANFGDAILSGETGFDHSTFEEGLALRELRITKGSRVSLNRVAAPHIDLEELNAHGELDLTDLNPKVEQRAVKLNLLGATFRTSPLSTALTELSAQSDLEGVIWPMVFQPGHIRRYEVLRHETERLGMQEVAKQLATKEQECRAKYAQGWDLLQRKVYGAISGYGASISRPLWYMISHYTLVVAPWLGCVAVGKTSLSVWEVMSYNFSRLVPLTSMRGLYDKRYIDAINDIPEALQFLSSTLALLGPLWLFLIALGLRHKFRLAR